MAVLATTQSSHLLLKFFFIIQSAETCVYQKNLEDLRANKIIKMKNESNKFGESVFLIIFNFLETRKVF